MINNTDWILKKCQEAEVYNRKLYGDAKHELRAQHHEAMKASLDEIYALKEALNKARDEMAEANAKVASLKERVIIRTSDMDLIIDLKRGEPVEIPEGWVIHESFLDHRLYIVMKDNSQ